MNKYMKYITKERALGLGIAVINKIRRFDTLEFIEDNLIKLYRISHKLNA